MPSISSYNDSVPDSVIFSISLHEDKFDDLIFVRTGNPGIPVVEKQTRKHLW
eukprot:COSAG02_NODE_2935_length_7705_cov_5.442677_1_plen_52_part_00